MSSLGLAPYSRDTRAVDGILALSVAIFGAACSIGGEAETPEVVVSGFTTVVTTESAILGAPVDIAVDDNGDVYVLDHRAAQVLVVGQDGTAKRALGRLGSGPGEFRRPSYLRVDRDSVRVVDPGNSRLLTLSRTGEVGRSVQLPYTASMGPVAISGDGGFLVTTLGLQGALAVFYDRSGTRVASLGTPLDSVQRIVDPRAINDDIIGGRVPALFRNAVLPVFAQNGDLWLVLNGEGLLQRYSEDGTLLFSVPLQEPEMKQVWQEIIARAKAAPPNEPNVEALQYVRDAAVLGTTLWLLLNTTKDGPAVLVAVSDTGRVERRLKFPGVRGASAFAIDKGRRRIFFAVLSNATLVATAFPDFGDE